MASPSPRTITPAPAPARPTLDDSTEDFGYWLQAHGRQVTIGAAVIAAVVLGGWWYRSSQANRANRADAAYLQAQEALATGDQATAQKQLQETAQRYRGTSGGTQAQLQLAQLMYDQGKYQDGLKVLEQASDAPKSLASAVTVLTAAGYEGEHKYAEAAKRYEDASKNTASAGERADLEANAARAYQAGGDRTNAARIWRDLAASDAQGIADEARVRLGELTAAAKP